MIISIISVIIIMFIAIMVIINATISYTICTFSSIVLHGNANSGITNTYMFYYYY